MSTRHILKHHPNTPADFQVEGAAEFLPNGDLSLVYWIRGNLDRILLPKGTTSGREDNLWKHTCLEAFILSAGPGYVEYNFSPNGSWQRYAFQEYRKPLETPISQVEPTLLCMLDGLLHLEIGLPSTMLPVGKVLHIGLCAVIEDQKGNLSYWALHHASSRPDFHQASSFVLQVERTCNSG